MVEERAMVASIPGCGPCCQVVCSTTIRALCKANTRLTLSKNRPAMRLRPDPASRVERVASIAAATAITVGTALLVLTPMRPRPEGDAGPAPVRHTEQASERLAYVIPHAPAPPVAPVRPRAPMSDRRAASMAPASQSAAPPAITPSVVPDTGNGSASQAVSPLLKPDAP